MIEKIKIIEKYKNVVAYDCEQVYLIEMKKGGVASDHIHDYKDVVFLMKGEVELTTGAKVQRVKAPKKITIPPNIYHKFIAMTNVLGIEIKLD